MKAKNSLVSKTNGLSLGEMHKNNKYVYCVLNKLICQTY